MGGYQYTTSSHSTTLESNKSDVRVSHDKSESPGHSG